MSSIQQISSTLSTNSTSLQQTISTSVEENADKTTVQEAAIYNASDSQVTTDTKTYKVDMEKVRSMKAETEQHMLELFTKTSSEGLLKQLGGLRSVIEKLISGESIDENFAVTPETIQKAQEDVAPGGYWSPESTSDRFLEFAKALSGDDPAKADLLLDAFKKGYEEAEKIWGGELPEISKKTYDLTIEKFNSWADSKKTQ